MKKIVFIVPSRRAPGYSTLGCGGMQIIPVDHDRSAEVSHDRKR
jgi:hypothetical protein